MKLLILYPELTQIGEFYFVELTNAFISSFYATKEYTIVVVLADEYSNREILDKIKLSDKYTKPGNIETVEAIPNFQNLTLKVILDSHKVFE